MGGEVVHDVQRQVRIAPGQYWVSQVPPVEGGGAMSYTIRAQQRFDLYVFTEETAYGQYEAFHQNGTPPETPSGHRDLSATAVRSENGDGFVVQTEDGGARQSFESQSQSYVVLDNSAYGMGADPGETTEPLRGTLELQVVETQLF